MDTGHREHRDGRATRLDRRDVVVIGLVLTLAALLSGGILGYVGAGRLDDSSRTGTPVLSIFLSALVAVALVGGVFGFVRRNAIWGRRATAPITDTVANERVGALMESLTEGFCVLDQDYRFRYVNAAERMNGTGRDELLGRTQWEVFPGCVGTVLERELRRAMAERVTTEFVNHYAPWNRWFALKAYPAPEGGICVLYRDITDSKRAELLLRVSEERFRAAVGAVSSLIWVSDPDGLIVVEQPGWESFTGQTFEQYRGWGWADAVHPEDAQPTIDT